ncbi:hypothetical protein [Burkholderia cenocepacia]|uniref:Uncharacterized protein n=1 Tax=Burkholderia cenocepacia TaxID=95486 RepID=A0A3S9N6S9_9BURK|nr:hypothetical protein [Burkholderia cenocepacia]AZQ51404.1 hypothetical protein D5R55_10520 [Burkholderia cenocepacia]
MSLLMNGDFLSGCSNWRILGPFDSALYLFWLMTLVNRGVAFIRNVNGLENNRMVDKLPKPENDRARVDASREGRCDGPSRRRVANPERRGK